MHSDADAGLPFVAEADVAVRLPGNAPADTYLRADLVIEAARRTGADAIHPGYGFLSENADFARAVEAAGLTWVGPTPESMEAMGSKVEAKRLMREAGVPTLEAPEHPTEADLPLLVKASAGGGGRGMRVVRSVSRTSTPRSRPREAEAASAFGDGTVFVEPYVERSRHVEVQVVGDRFGRVLVLGERDCSLQRRHQKVVEEAPAPDLAAEVAAALHDAARKAAEAIGYVGAGTVEFLYDPATERFFFLEMNTRLQVEHPVTEAVFGVDLVELQLRVAEGGRARRARPTRPRGPRDRGADLRRGPGRRLPAAVRSVDGLRGAEHLDLRAARSRRTRGRRLRSGRRGVDALRRDAGQGHRLGADPRRGGPDARRGPAPRAHPRRHDQPRPARRRARRPGVPRRARCRPRCWPRAPTASWTATSQERWSAIAAAVALAEHDRLARTVQQGIPVAWRNVTSQPQRTALTVAGRDEPMVVEWFGTRDGYVVDGATVLAAGADAVTLEMDGLATTFAVAVTGRGGRRRLGPWVTCG